MTRGKCLNQLRILLSGEFRNDEEAKGAVNAIKENLINLPYVQYLLQKDCSSYELKIKKKSEIYLTAAKKNYTKHSIELIDLIYEFNDFTWEEIYHRINKIRVMTL